MTMVNKDSLKREIKIPSKIRPEMFYAKCLANKNSPLRLIWIAAHWEKKVSKNQVFRTDIKAIVNEICRNKISISLRISGHLMYGIVRIFSRKVKYLLTECDEALSAIRFGLVPKESIDLVSAVDKKETVTMEQTFGLLEEEFNIDFLTGTSLAFNLDLTAHQCRKEDITLKEPNCPMISSFMVEDNFDFGDMDELLKDLQLLPVIMEGSSFHRPLQGLSKDITAKKVDVACVPETHLDEVINQSKPSKRKSRVEEVSVADEIGVGKHKRVKISDDIEFIGKSGLQPEDLVASKDLDITLDKNILYDPDTTIKLKKRRKLIIDQTIVISKLAMKRHLSDTAVILQAGVELAPPTKKIMTVSENGRVPQIFHRSSQHLIHPILIQMLESNMIVSPEDDHQDVPDIEVARREAKNGREENMCTLNISIENDAPVEPSPAIDVVQVLDGLKEKEHITDEAQNGQADLPSKEVIKDKKAKKRSDSSTNDLTESKENVPELQVSPELFASPRCCRFSVFDPFSPLENNTRAHEMVTAPKKTKAPITDLKRGFIKFLRNKLHGSGDTISFSSALKDLQVQSKHEACFLFYTLLEMKKDGFIDVAQAESYSHINLSRGPKFKNLSYPRT